MYGIPELSLLSSDKDRLRILKVASREATPGARQILTAMTCEILAMAAVYFALEFLRAYFGIQFPFPLATALIIGSIGSVIIYARMFRDPLRKAVRRKLNEEGIPICIPCGYDLRGLNSSKCPECDAPIAAAPPSANPKLPPLTSSKP